MVRAETRARAEEKARAEEREKTEAKESADAQARAEAEARREQRERAKALRKTRAKQPKRPRESLRVRRARRRRRRKGMTRKERLALYRGQINELGAWTKDVGRESRRRARDAGAEGRRRAQPLLARARRLLAPVASAVAAVLGPVWRLIRAVLVPIAPIVSAALFLALRAIGGLLDAMLRTAGWFRDLLVGVAGAIWRWADAHVTAARTFALIAAAGAVALAVSQFIDYRATAIGADQYSGEVGTVAPPPEIDQEPSGDAHFYALLPLAVLALPLIWLALRGRSRMAWAVAGIGVIGIVVTMAVDLPQGLDTGDAGSAYAGTEANLIEGFWTQLFASLALFFCGLGLARSANEPSERRDVRPARTGPPPPERPGPGHGGEAAGWGTGA